MRLGIDLGGTKISAVVLADDGREVWRERVPTPRGEYEGTIDVISRLVARAEAGVSARVTVGLGIPGAASRATGLIKNANSIWLIGKPFQADLERALRREVRLANDANCLAVSEATDGAAAGADVVFAVILGTGTGGGVVVRGRLIEGANAIGGEWGHNPLPWPDHEEHAEAGECYCGRRGCIETWLSGPGIAADHARCTGARLSSEQVVTLASRGDLAAEDTLVRWERRLAKSLATVINLLDPDVIVIGGGLSRLERIYGRIPELWGAWVFSDTVTTRLVQAQHGDDSGVRGAAWLWGPDPIQS